MPDWTDEVGCKPPVCDVPPPEGPPPKGALRWCGHISPSDHVVHNEDTYRFEQCLDHPSCGGGSGWTVTMHGHPSVEGGSKAISNPGSTTYFPDGSAPWGTFELWGVASKSGCAEVVGEKMAWTFVET